MITARMSGVVTYSDGTTTQFAAHLDDQGNISVNDLTENRTSGGRVSRDGDWLTDMLSLLPGGTALLPNDPGASGPTVTDLTVEFSGRVANTNGTWGDWIVQYTSKTGAYVPDGGDVSNFTLATGLGLADLTELFDSALGGTAATGPSIQSFGFGFQPSFPVMMKAGKWFHH